MNSFEQALERAEDLLEEMKGAATLRSERDQLREVLRAVVECPHWNYCDSLWHKGYDRHKPEYDKCDCHVSIAKKGLEK